jgi:hypothetical protein
MLLTPGHLRAALEWIAAAAAFIAAATWYRASRYPVAQYTSATYGDISKKVAPLNAKIQRGAVLNARAAICAGISALAQGVALLIPYIWHG